MILALLQKDFRNAVASFLPAVFTVIAILFIFQITQPLLPQEQIRWSTALWVAVYLASTSLFYRSFGSENRSRNFVIYSMLAIPRWKIFASQAAVHALTVYVLFMATAATTVFFWNPPDVPWGTLAALGAAVAVTLAPLGTLLGLVLQTEREFLHTLIYLPLATPVILASAELLGDPSQLNWRLILGLFFIGSLFMSAFAFEFFFDELSEAS